MIMPPQPDKNTGYEHLGRDSEGCFTTEHAKAIYDEREEIDAEWPQDPNDGTQTVDGKPIPLDISRRRTQLGSYMSSKQMGPTKAAGHLKYSSKEGGYVWVESEEA